MVDAILRKQAAAFQEQIEELEASIMRLKYRTILLEERLDAMADSRAAPQSESSISSSMPDRDSASAAWLRNIKATSNASSSAYYIYLPTFDSAAEDLPVEWLRSCVERLIEFRENQEDWSRHIGSNLNRKHQLWYQALRAQHSAKIPWNIFLSKFLNEFQLQDPYTTLLAQVRTLRNKQVEPAKLIEKFRKVMILAPKDTFSCGQLQVYFLDALPDRFEQFKNSLGPLPETMELLFSKVRQADATQPAKATKLLK